MRRSLAAVVLAAILALASGLVQPPSARAAGPFSDWAAIVVAGDFHFIRQNMPDDLGGKTVLTNTVTAANVKELRARGVTRLVTSTPELGGRSFGTNVMEAALLALLGKRWDEVAEGDYLDVLRRLRFHPRIEELNPAGVKSTVTR